MPYKDREKQLEAQRRAYHAKKDHYLGLQKIRRKNLKKWLQEEILAEAKCNRCPESHSGCLDFHHIDPLQKSEGISVMVKKTRTKDAILAEIEKCEILCANCHRKHHYEERMVIAAGFEPAT